MSGRITVIGMRLGDIARAIGADVGPSDAPVMVEGLTTDSRDVRPGDLFVAIRGKRFDGAAFIDKAFAAGAVACVVSASRSSSAGCSRRDTSRRPEPTAPDVCARRDGGGAGRCLVVDDSVKALGRLAGYYRRRVMDESTVVIAVTGSNGKTTTKWMIDHVLSADLPGQASPKNFNNHIGVPLTLLSARRTDRYLVVEIGTSAPGEVDALSQMAQPDIGVITSIGVAHTEGLGDLEAIAAEKASLLRHVRPDTQDSRPGGFAVVNVDDARIMRHLPPDYVTADGDLYAKPTGTDAVAESGGYVVRSGRFAQAEACGSLNEFAQAEACGSSKRRVLCTVGRPTRAELRISGVETSLRGTSFILDGVVGMRLSTPGGHSASNAAIAYAVGRRMGVVADQIVQRLGTFQSPGGRGKVIDAGGLTIIDDCYNANPSSMTAALGLLAHSDGLRRVLVMGDMLELGADSECWHRRMGEAAADAGVDLLLTIGSASRVAAEAASGGVRSITCFDQTADAAEHVRGVVRAGDTVLVKGSRAMGLEQVVERLAGRPSTARVVVA